MVMEMPSAQCVGQEFVRQYYTLLHEAPDYMHRFYSHDSSFVHGGVEKPGEELPPVMGQMAIHKKIMSLNFRDCRAKIRQVDSQATIDQAVVVQVAGELSNDGQPMRRFMQTFVLAPQSPKKYYVHNDIFRYQDEVFHDGVTDSEPEVTELDTSNGYECSDEPVDTYSEKEHDITASNGNVCSGDVTDKSVSSLKPAVGKLTVADGPELQQNVCAEAQLPVDVEQEANVAVSSSSEIYQPLAADSPVISAAAEVEPLGIQMMPSTSNTVTTDASTAEAKVLPEPLKQVSWAALAGKNVNSLSASQLAGPAVSKPQATVKPEIKSEISAPIVAPLPQRSPLIDRPSMERDTSSGFGCQGSSEFEDSTRRPPRHPDNQQVFVGNLPHIISDHELRQYFEKFGTVVDVRVNRRGPSKDVPNFAFVVFDKPDTVQKVLESRPLFILDGKLRLNIEEKKQQSDYRAGGGVQPRGGPRGGYRGSGPPHGVWRGRIRGPRGYNQGRSSDDEYSGDDHGYEQLTPTLHMQ
jgi:Ras GTPase-activating protein-binding protein 1